MIKFVTGIVLTITLLFAWLVAHEAGQGDLQGYQVDIYAIACCLICYFLGDIKLREGK